MAPMLNWGERLLLAELIPFLEQLRRGEAIKAGALKIQSADYGCSIDILISKLKELAWGSGNIQE